MGRPNYYEDIRAIRQAQDALVRILGEMAADLHRYVDATIPPLEVVGIQIQPGIPSFHQPEARKHVMATATVKLLKKSKLGLRKLQAGPFKPQAAGVDFGILDNEDCSFTVVGLDAAGNPVDISSVATLTPPPTSSDTALITLDPPTGMTDRMHAVGPVSTPGTPVQVTATATWNDGSLGPFSFSLPVDVTANPNSVTGVQIVPGTPTVH